MITTAEKRKIVADILQLCKDLREFGRFPITERKIGQLLNAEPSKTEERISSIVRWYNETEADERLFVAAAIKEIVGFKVHKKGDIDQLERLAKRLSEYVQDGGSKVQSPKKLSAKEQAYAKAIELRAQVPQVKWKDIKQRWGMFDKVSEQAFTRRVKRFQEKQEKDQSS
jgi:hypothetical protein